MRIALFLTLTRLFITPIFIVCYLFYEKMGIDLATLPYILLSLLAVCELTDALDGYAARKLGQVTDLGKILDPMADSIMRQSLLLVFTQGIVGLPILLSLIFVYRDAITSTLRTVCALSGIALGARKSGKIKAIFQASVVFAILLMMIPYTKGWISLEFFQNFSFYIVSAAAVYSVASAFEYLLVHKREIKHTLHESS